MDTHTWTHLHLILTLTLTLTLILLLTPTLPLVQTLTHMDTLTLPSHSHFPSRPASGGGVLHARKGPGRPAPDLQLPRGRQGVTDTYTSTLHLPGGR